MKPNEAVRKRSGGSDCGVRMIGRSLKRGVRRLVRPPVSQHEKQDVVLARGWVEKCCYALRDWRVTSTCKRLGVETPVR